MRTWVEAVPGRLEYELAEFAERGLAFSLDQEQLEEQGRVILRGSLPHNGAEIALEVRYPDLFPHLRPEVVAPELDLPRHQNPYGKNLCLLDRSSRAWDADDTAAWLVAERVPYLLSLLEGDTEDLRKAEVPQGEPSSYYFQGLPGSIVFVPQAALELPAEAQAGSGRIAFSVMEPPQFELRGLVAELVEKGRNRKTRTLAKADEPLARHFAGEQIAFRWARLTQNPKQNTPAGVLEAIERSRAGFGSPPWQAAHDCQLAVAGAVFKEEVGQGKFEDAWVFVVRFRHESQGEGAYLIRAQRLSRRDLEVRLPTALRLGGKTVSLVGLGSVGAGLALELARSGLAELRGMDFDTVEVGTTVRWPLGLSAAGRLKVGAIARRMDQDYPYTEFEPNIHHLGQSGGRTAARLRSELDILDAFLADTHLMIDASAEIGVQQVLSEQADERGIPQLYVSTTEGAMGGLVARVIPSVTGCWMCLQYHLDDNEAIPAPAQDEAATVQPRGCSTRTFVGAGFDISPVIAQGARVAAAMLCGTAGAVEAADRRDVFVYSFADDRLLPPQWSAHTLTPHPKCPVCFPPGE